MESGLFYFLTHGDFTPVCTTEFLAFAKMYPEFKCRNTELLGLSIDSNPSHLAWLNNIYRHTGIQIPFPVISDLDMKISRMYGMIAPNASTTQTVRCVFFIDPNQKVRAKLEYPMQNGRNIGEILRLLEAMQVTDSQNVYTPANWIPGAPTIVPAPTTFKQLLERTKNPNDFNCMDWYLCFNNSKDCMQMGSGMNPNNFMTSGLMPSMGSKENMGFYKPAALGNASFNMPEDNCTMKKTRDLDDESKNENRSESK